MGWIFRKRVTIAPGVRLNLGKRGVSISFGVRGLRTTIGPRGTSTSVGVPGTGLYFKSRQTLSPGGAGTMPVPRLSAQRIEQDLRHPARHAFLERQRQKRQERMNFVPASELNPLVCRKCLYERRPKDQGPFSVCPACGNSHASSAPRVGPRTRTPTFNWAVWLAIGVASLAALVILLRAW